MKDAVTQLKYKYSIRLYHQQNLKYVDRFLSVLCWLFDIQFQSSKKHKVHQQYTLADVAKLAGVSLKTASRAMNEEYGVAQSTAERVLAAARELGFRPNRLAQSQIGRAHV